MSNIDSLRERGSALENQFFANLDAELLAKLKAEVSQESAIAEFSRITGIKDHSVLSGVVKLGVTPQTIAALRVFPLVAVAWADGTLDEAEKNTVSQLAAQHIGSENSPSAELLKAWLSNKPGEYLLAAWESYAKALVASLPIQEAESIKTTLLNEIRAVATASGGLLGFAAVSKGESTLMRRIEAALTRA